MSDDGSGPAAEEFAEYCRTQARLLAGRVETLRAETGDLLDEIDDEIEAARERLDAEVSDAAGTVSPQTPDGPEADAVAELEDLGSELETKQAVVEAKQARLSAFQDLAAGYADLAEALRGEDDGAALERVVAFEVDNDAPAYFPDRTTVAEAAAESSDSADASDAEDAAGVGDAGDVTDPSGADDAAGVGDGSDTADVGDDGGE